MSRAICAGCERDKPVYRRMPDGRPRCRNCHHRDPATWEPCGGCGQTKRVNARAADGTARCMNCYRKSCQPKLPCDRCGELAHPVVRAGRRGGHTETLGPCCYRNENRLCGGCGRIRRVRVKATANSADLCGTCHQAAITACTRCGTVTRCRGTTTARQPICWRCHLTDRFDELLVQPDGTILPALKPIRDAVLSVDNPATGLRWLGRSRGATLLAQLAAEQLPLTHDALDQQPPGFSVEHLRRMLVAAGALPERNEHLARLEAFAQRTADAIDTPQDRRLLRSYATWHVIHRLRNDRPRPATWPASGYRARHEITAAARLLTDLRQQDRSLDTLHQADIDAYLTSSALRSFLTWATSRKIITGVQLPKRRTTQPLRFAADEHRWHLARTLLNDDASATVSDRFAGLLVLLYAQPVTRIARLTTGHVRQADGITLLTIGTAALQLPSPLADLAARLPERRPVGMAGNLHTNQWLFPGRQPDRPADPATLMHRLNALGIHTRDNRNTAMLQLAAELPAVVIADLLGVHIGTATRWVHESSGNWTTYAGKHSQ
ncbi:hypothetical protein ACIA5D_27380 [Actinoplanes sp. NPDC051513]|uniref:hypothetical protein n=1 Tax=Actinoplanes sp. NPDC051513 TaxID=3363908 RepID=UPI0037968967